jgi:general secretion pathway protein K
VLLAVLWLTAGLMAIAFSVATTVRSETERTSTASEGLRAHYLASGAVDRAICYMMWGPGQPRPDGTPQFYNRTVARLEMPFPSGLALVDIVPETAKFSVNRIEPAELERLLVNLRVPPERAVDLAAAIVDWRTPSAAGFSPFDPSSFRPRHASIEEIEELLLVRGMTPEIFYGGHTRDAEGRIVPLAGLKDCVSVYGSTGPVDANFAEPAVLATVGVSPAVIPSLVERRRARPFRDSSQLAEFAQWGGPGFSRLQVGGEVTIYTLRSSARLRLPNGQLSDVRRDASAQIKLRTDGAQPPFDILRWAEN